ncbi:MAG: hypothetical protein E6J05_12385 [Chloroflexi bacterium]|nr:MAG: hypothetical protein E6J05_12385 [Chloroflexota bacterium]
MEVIRPREVRAELARRGAGLVELYGREAKASGGRRKERAKLADKGVQTRQADALGHRRRDTIGWG